MGAEWVLLGWLVFEIATGGLSTAVVAGAATGVARETGRHAVASHSAWRARRVAELSRTPWGRARLRVGGWGRGAARGLWRGVRHGAVPGARAGLRVRRRAINAAKARVGAVVGRLDPARDTDTDTDTDADPEPADTTPDTNPAPIEDATTDATDPTQEEDDMNPYTTNTLDTLDTLGDSVATEVTGAASYVTAWSDIPAVLEVIEARLKQIADGLSSTTEHGERYDTGAGRDVAINLMAAAECVSAAREKVDVHAADLADEHAAGIEALSGGQSQAAREYVGQV